MGALDRVLLDVLAERVEQSAGGGGRRVAEDGLELAAASPRYVCMTATPMELALTSGSMRSLQARRSNPKLLGSCSDAALDRELHEHLVSFALDHILGVEAGVRESTPSRVAEPAILLVEERSQTPAAPLAGAAARDPAAPRS